MDRSPQSRKTQKRLVRPEAGYVASKQWASGLAAAPCEPTTVLHLPAEERVLGVGGLSGPVCLSPLPALPPVGRTPVPDPAQNGLDESDVVLAHRASGGGEI